MQHFNRENKTKTVKPKLSNHQVKQAEDYAEQSLSARQIVTNNENECNNAITIEDLDLYDGPSFLQR